eukprot:CAMPEP_0184489148 /NCGR_PEP_ID=MMETSP0113_2-20130426/14562_1 /TAXON_ID=91329 /ORGANISM="Norrisiella sphaerica, Strain BC52" /LENGTH=515 /DNA_ID=CAMNT_0026872403 /DNA_START=52 /DNA_END=1599 /DNA_ORIENTATION=+
MGEKVHQGLDKVEAADDKKTDIDFSSNASLREDLPSIFLLTALYIFQGIPIGIAVSLIAILKERGASFSQLSTFLLSSWPFSLKILWAPFVDSIYSTQFGRRKTWLVPVQLLLGIGLYMLSSNIDAWIQKDNLQVNALTGTMFIMYFLAATQDIAVDGWALTMLKSTGWASTCNTVGQSIGVLLSSTGYFFLASNGWITLDKFLRIASYSFITATIGVGAIVNEQGLCSFPAISVSTSSFSREKESHTKRKKIPNEPSDKTGSSMSSIETDSGDTPSKVFGMMLRVVRLPRVQELLVILFTWKFGFSCAESVLLLKLQETSFSKESITYMRTIVSPLEMLVPVLVSEYTTSTRPLDLALWMYLPRITLGIIACFIVAFAPPTEEVTWKFTGLVIIFLGFQSVLSTSMFTSQMAFFARVSDPSIGGSYMTLLNTFANLGYLWTTLVSTRLVEVLTIKNDNNVYLDGFYLTSAVCAVVGVIWFFFMRGRLKALQLAPLTSWRVDGSNRSAMKSVASL